MSLARVYVSSSQASPIGTVVPLEALDSLGSFSNMDQDHLNSAFHSITRNTQTALSIAPHLTAQNLSSCFTGTQLRWEWLALVFAWAGLALSMSLPSTVESVDSYLPRDTSRLDFAAMLLQHSNASILLSRWGGPTNDLLVWALYENLVLLVSQHGDASKSFHRRPPTASTRLTHYCLTGDLSWQRLGDLSTDVFALGLHRDPLAHSTAPAFLLQARKKLFAAAYRLDKSISIFFGRPPRIIWRYCNVTLPLDIDDAHFRTSSTTLDHVSSSLTSDGWSCDGNVRPASWLRVRFGIARLKEQVLELFLESIGPDPAARIRSSALRAPRGSGGTSADMSSRQAEQSCEQFWRSTPSHIRYDFSQESANTLSREARHLQLLVYLEHLQNSFQLKRLLAEHNVDKDRCGVVDVSWRMLAATMAQSQLDDETPSANRDRIWTVSRRST